MQHIVSKSSAITGSKANGLFLFQNQSLPAQFWNKARQTFEYSVTLNISAQYIGYCSNIFSSKIAFTVQDPSCLVSKLQDPKVEGLPHCQPKANHFNKETH